MTEDELIAERKKIAEAATRGAAPMTRAIAAAQSAPRQIDRILNAVKGIGGEDDDFDENEVAMIALRITGKSYKAISELLGVPMGDVRRVLAEARRLAKLSDVGPILDNIALPQAVDNLVDKLEAGDMTATLATLRGRGAFRNFERSDNVDMQLQLSVQIEQPAAGAPEQPVAPGSIVGVPRKVGAAILVDEREDDQA